jgi:hypothetical protein
MPGPRLPAVGVGLRYPPARCWRRDRGPIRLRTPAGTKPCPRIKSCCVRSGLHSIAVKFPGEPKLGGGAPGGHPRHMRPFGPGTPAVGRRWRAGALEIPVSHSTPSYVAELYGAKSDLPEILDSLPFNADSPTAAKRMLRNWAAQAGGAADSARVRLRHCNTTVMDKQVAELLRPDEIPAPGHSAEQQTADSQTPAHKLLEPIMAGLELARSALTSR